MAQANSLPKMPCTSQYHPSHFAPKAQPTPPRSKGSGRAGVRSKPPKVWVRSFPRGLARRLENKWVNWTMNAEKSLIDADRCWTEFISSSSFPAWRSEEWQCRRYAAACHYFSGHTHSQNRLCCESRAHPGADAMLRGKPWEKGNQLEGRSLMEDLVADMEILGLVVGLHKSGMRGRIQMERCSKNMITVEMQLVMVLLVSSLSGWQCRWDRF